MDTDTGRCECGCNGVTNVSPRNNKERGHVKGEHVRFLPGHNQRKPQTAVPEDRGYKTLCSIWQGNYGHGYGIARDGSAAHRFIYAEAYGPIAEGLEIHHLCGVKMCVRLDHLEARTWHEHREAHNGPAKVTREMALQIMVSTETYVRIAERFGISVGYVGNIRKGWALNEFTGLPKRPKNGSRYHKRKKR
jgi:hypothetical protein